MTSRQCGQVTRPFLESHLAWKLPLPQAALGLLKSPVAFVLAALLVLVEAQVHVDDAILGFLSTGLGGLQVFLAVPFHGLPLSDEFSDLSGECARVLSP